MSNDTEPGEKGALKGEQETEVVTGTLGDTARATWSDRIGRRVPPARAYKLWPRWRLVGGDPLSFARWRQTDKQTNKQ